MTGVWALLAFVAVIIVWNAVFKRNIGEAMILGFVAVCAFAVVGGTEHGGSAWSAIGDAVADALQEEVTFAGLAFVFMSYLLSRTPVLDRLIDLLNSVLGRLRGGPVYTATVAGGIFGAIAHVGAAVTAAVGAVTVPWMKRSGVRPELAATVVAGGAGMGVSFPFSATMFILVGGLAAQGIMQPDEIVAPLALAGLWCLGYRIVLAWFLVRRNGIEPVAEQDRLPLRRSLRSGWTSLLLFLPILVPLLLTRGPLADALGGYAGVGEELKKPVRLADGTALAAQPYAMSDVISLITWIPVLMIALVLFLGRRHLPRTASGWWSTLGKAAPSFGVIGITIVAAFSASNVLADLGLASQLEAVLASLEASSWIMAVAIGVIIVAIAIPLTASATMAAVGPVAVAALVGAGIPAPVAAAAVLIFASTEGASPPSGAPIYVAAGIAQVDPVKTFLPLLKYYCLPILALGVLIAVGVLPV
ncbi:TRAP transporter large permease subunit [Goodfellowiella coeruleoviolacea]|uniref:TRAP-type C4-dicarboxylate transport system, large permease component n=1 Tax=Goodfellowiella coeruleoviolacea TaxID=334858 RepID=A0AAE3GE45_9PSEU|nr:TRAP transporter large permease subunit [Goodfellowiella coeruleoviolacea]MCP2166592.1 TRAP-type C4-dicarboxylate transport system, large permease component [Goodfellowiella coeruleoviolacea]